jgi:hypothetical protein
MKSLWQGDSCFLSTIAQDSYQNSSKKREEALSSSNILLQIQSLNSKAKRTYIKLG